MSTSTNATTNFPSPQDWKNWLEQILPRQGAFRRGESAASVLLTGFAVDVAAAFDAD